MSDMITDCESLLGQSSLSGPDGRRGFLKVALGTGFAVAVLPVAAQNVIKTDSAGLVTGHMSVMVDGQAVPVYAAQPEGKTGLPVVLVISEIFGVHEHIADMARRFAKQGYLALAPDLFVRQGDPTKVASIPELMKGIIAKTPDAQVMTDLDAVVAWAKQNGGDTSRLGITGFCWGGRITWLYAAHNPAVKAGVAWYGRLVGEPTALQPSNPIDIAATLKVPVLGLYGGKDTGISQESIGKMKDALAKGGNPSEFVVYPDAGHAFNADYRPSYVAADAKDGYARCLAWFKSHGVA
ncbi:dienelactone hydrolase family protein [Janthinobacterium sp. SUN128]|uniref:dienelactone hydrolase family protein n=1 Tax=Janthinobacterium sp. SUN128 TaxID=3014790 RepID=UPI00271393AC|nr:dienelactone hydrolase family protein [Janthinobacterium sp. SUN128]MDO8037142.1 dienelactone hydrolase family protein [Janthinobacterium sp. SUN128]